jgi:hypothetical protein
MCWNRNNPGGVVLLFYIAECPIQQYTQRVSQMAMSLKLEFPNQLSQFSRVRPVGSGNIEGNGSYFAGRTSPLDFQHTAGQRNATVVADPWAV